MQSSLQLSAFVPRRHLGCLRSIRCGQILSSRETTRRMTRVAPPNTKSERSNCIQNRKRNRRVPQGRGPSGVGRSIVRAWRGSETAALDFVGHDGRDSSDWARARARRIQKEPRARTASPISAGIRRSSESLPSCPAPNDASSPLPSMTAPARPAKCAFFRGGLNRSMLLSTCNRQWSIVEMMGCEHVLLPATGPDPAGTKAACLGMY